MQNFRPLSTISERINLIYLWAIEIWVFEKLKPKTSKRYADADTEVTTIALPELHPGELNREYLTFESTTKAVFSRVAKPWVKILLLVFMSEIKNNLLLKKSNFLFLFCL